MLGSRRTKDFQAISGCMLLQNCGDGGHHLQSGAGEGTIPLMRMYKVTKAMY